MISRHILYIDNVDERRLRLTSRMSAILGARVEAVSRIDRTTLESCEYDFIFVHARNEEEAKGLVKGGWDKKNAVIILFTGGWTDDIFEEYREGYFRVSANRLEREFDVVWQRLETK